MIRRVWARENLEARESVYARLQLCAQRFRICTECYPRRPWISYR